MSHNAVVVGGLQDQAVPLRAGVQSNSQRLGDVMPEEVEPATLLFIPHHAKNWIAIGVGVHTDERRLFRDISF